MKLALFDLDHTLIPFDSGMAWTRHLIAYGALPPEAEPRYLDFCHQYVAGTLDIHAMHREVVRPLRDYPPEQLRDWRESFAQQMAGRLSASMRRAVEQHRAEGDVCAIVTATSRLVAEPFAQACGIEHLMATEPVLVDGRPDGAIAGLPCYREHKVGRVAEWLASIGAPALEQAEQSWFYSDSISDLPLLQRVSHPVAVRPDARLREMCRIRGWRIIDDV